MSSRLFLIFDHSHSHPLVYLSAAAGPEEAIRIYLREMESDLRFDPDGSLRLVVGRREVRYPHVLAYVEAHYKSRGEWQLREVPVGSCRASLTEAFCGEDESDTEGHLNACRKLLRRDYPRSRAAGFIWYIRGGVLVTFYRHRGREIEVLRRYVRRWPDDDDYLPWTGDCADLMRLLYLGSGDAARLVE